MSDVRTRLEKIVADHNLLNHPFYQSWSAGTLPVEALATYAAEWGNFVAQVPKGWAAHGDQVIADEEVTHVALWDDFASALGTEVAPSKIKEMKSLTQVCDKNFGESVPSVGALFAFEAQQPHTSTSKLEGLKKWYSLGEKGEEYFRIHCDDIHEMEILAQRAEKMSPEDQDETVSACEETAKALWNALTGIHMAHCGSMTA
ncbi:MAG: iron-containing redox enzyme family protein [Chthonomonadaceae bacterium]|nr:iron-containing redox enzyme family protein [Chthonomonadaceae bacterium]